MYGNSGAKASIDIALHDLLGRASSRSTRFSARSGAAGSQFSPSSDPKTPRPTFAILALDAAGRFLAMRATNISNVGAHCVSLSPLSKGAGLIPGSYVVPAATLRAVAVFTNTMPTQAYRSSGRPEVTYAIERLVDIAAAELGMDRVALRRKNLVRPEAMPYRNAVGMLYDSGRYEENMDWALAVADWKGFPARRREAARRGKLLGLGLANYVESSIGAPREQARIEVQPEGRVDVIIGTQPSGQGHETSFAQVVSDLLHVPAESVRIILGASAAVLIQAARCAMPPPCSPRRPPILSPRARPSPRS